MPVDAQVRKWRRPNLLLASVHGSFLAIHVHTDFIIVLAEIAVELDVTGKLSGN